jgi:NAD(P)-dependent dehydrogenase (short-subunit alcohol dehydrogenase family)
LALAEAGADVAICDLLEAKGEQTRLEIESLGRRSLFARVDVTQPQEIERFARQVIDSLGKADILVNNAGITSQGRRLEQETDEFWRHIVETNLSSVFYFSRVIARHMIERGEGGAIINMGSMSGFIINNLAPRANVPYCVTKAAVLHLTRGMAADWAQYGIRVNAIAPGYMVTEQTGYVDQNPELRERLLLNTPLKRFGGIDELKGTIVYLASKASSFMTGSVIVVDGGTTVW